MRLEQKVPMQHHETDVTIDHACLGAKLVSLKIFLYEELVLVTELSLEDGFGLKPVIHNKDAVAAL